MPIATAASIGVRPISGPDGAGRIYLIKVVGSEGATARGSARIYYFSHDRWFKDSILGRLQEGDLTNEVMLPYPLIPIRTGRRYLPARFEKASNHQGVVIAETGEMIAEIFDITDCLSQYPECRLRPC